jgi:outer membrane protein assembly factor BamD (BamD/ComL family)
MLRALLRATALLSMSGSALAMSAQSVGQSFAGAAPSGLLAGDASMAGSSSDQPSSNTPPAAKAPETSQFDQGIQAINQSRWADAARLFSAVSALHGEHAEAALYWKAYAESFLSQSKLSLAACGELRSSYPKSRWIDDCKALEIEINARTGKHVQIKPDDSDDVKLLAINAMMRQN